MLARITLCARVVLVLVERKVGDYLKKEIKMNYDMSC